MAKHWDSFLSYCTALIPASSTNQNIFNSNVNGPKVIYFLLLSCVVIWHLCLAAQVSCAVIGWMGAINAIAELNGNGICHLENAMTMRSYLQDVFDNIGLLFEATVQYYITCFGTDASNLTVID